MPTISRITPTNPSNLVEEILRLTQNNIVATKQTNSRCQKTVKNTHQPNPLWPSLMVSHTKLKEVLLDKTWAKKHDYTCFSGDSKPFYLSREVEYRPDAVWKSRRGTLHIVEIPDQEDWRAVVGEFFLAATVPNAVSFTAMVNEGREWLKPCLSRAWASLSDWTRGEEDSENCPMYKPQLIVIPKEFANNKEKIEKFLNRAWK
jgi:hypothetical protein